MEAHLQALVAAFWDAGIIWLHLVDISSIVSAWRVGCGLGCNAPSIERRFRHCKIGIDSGIQSKNRLSVDSGDLGKTAGK